MILVVLASLGAGWLYAAKYFPARVPAEWRIFGEAPPGHATMGGTPLGLSFGTVALGIFIFAALLGMRKRLPGLFPGSVRAWLRAHVWLTLLTVPLILLHSGFRLGSPMTTLLMGLYAVVMGSGFFGLILQQALPGWMKDRLQGEIVYEQIPNILGQLAGAARKLLKSYRPVGRGEGGMRMGGALARPGWTEGEMRRESAGAATMEAEPTQDAPSEELLAKFIERQLLPYLEARRGERFRLGREHEAGEIFRHLKVQVAATYRAGVDEMEGWCEERRGMDRQVRMQHWLHGWLFVHVPLSFLLLLLTGWHAFVTLFRY